MKKGKAKKRFVRLLTYQLPLSLPLSLSLSPLSFGGDCRKKFVALFFLFRPFSLFFSLFLFFLSFSSFFPPFSCRRLQQRGTVWNAIFLESRKSHISFLQLRVFSFREQKISSIFRGKKLFKSRGELKTLFYFSFFSFEKESFEKRKGFSKRHLESSQLILVNYLIAILKLFWIIILVHIRPNYKSSLL